MTHQHVIVGSICGKPGTDYGGTCGSGHRGSGGHRRGGRRRTGGQRRTGEQGRGRGHGRGGRRRTGEHGREGGRGRSSSSERVQHLISACSSSLCPDRTWFLTRSS